MTPTKILIGQILITFMVVIGTLWAAFMLGFQARLGTPWLGHVMVSRQETARQLLTPGEVMQLPMDQELIQIAGLPPIRARKLRYYEVQNFTTRILPPAPTLIVAAISQSGYDWGDQEAGPDGRLLAPNVENEGDMSGDTALKHIPELMPEPDLSEEPIDIFEVIDPDVDDVGVEADKYQLSTFQKAVAFDDEQDLPGLGNDLGPGRGDDL
ncbi:Coupling protein VirD4, ATPase required for T-DNA transfer [hydrothermal vent metagenome]|uniref:Coupling protein VirD4, ATPase required for T-DNA transfer n=1 Tax=hydrothermal vent metagenome TaxID=652676 RepID=A0A3B0RXZ0_9ZZZZ